MLRLEHHRQALATPAVYRRRLLIAAALGAGLVGISLAVGIAGYMAFEGLGALDAFLNAAMLLSGMGPLHNPTSVAGKVFAGIYALYSGFAVLATAAIMFAPILHRFFHRFHVAEEDLGEASEKKPAPRKRSRSAR